MKMPYHPPTLALCIGMLCANFSPDIFATTSDDIKKWCTGSSAVASGRCIGFLLAVEDAVTLGLWPTPSVCLPNKTNLGQLHGAVIAELRHPTQKSGGTGFELIAHAYAMAFPCPQ